MYIHNSSTIVDSVFDGVVDGLVVTISKLGGARATNDEEVPREPPSSQEQEAHNHPHAVAVPHVVSTRQNPCAIGRARRRVHPDNDRQVLSGHDR